jgi:RimJ/RimL family protein N-acetyltransferase
MSLTDNELPPAAPDLHVVPHKRVHASRDRADSDLRGEVSPVTWDQKRLAAFLRFYYHHQAKYDDAIKDEAPEVVAQQILSATPYTFEFGNFSGLGVFYPIRPGNEAQAHIFLWDPMYYRRPALLRAVMRHAVKKWDLRRLTGLIPANRTLALRTARSCGFQEEGRMRHGVVYNGVPHDMVVMGLLREELF